MRHLTRTAAATAAALITTGAAAVTGLGLAAAHASTTSVGTDTVTVNLTANEANMAIDYSQELCGSDIVPPLRGKTPFVFETARCVSGIGYCAVYTPAGKAMQVVFYADRFVCYDEVAAAAREAPSGGDYGARVERHRVLVSAHRCGYSELGTVGGHEDPLTGVVHSAQVGADFCEFDVRRCADGTFVVSHDADGGTGDESLVIADLTWPELHDRAPGVCSLDELLTALEATGMGAHVDLKLRTPSAERKAGATWELDAVAAVAARLDPSRIVVTTGVQRTTTGLRSWAAEQGIPLIVALSIGGSVRGLTWRDAVRTRWRELFPQLRFRQSEADAVAAHFALAMIRLSRWTTHIGVPLLVWTVDSAWLQRRFLHDRRIWMITTNRPAQAVALRDRPHPRRWLP